MHTFFGKQISGRFTIPSGIVTTNVPTINWVGGNIPEVGIITTKSVGPIPRAGNKEPIYLEYGEQSYMNAVGLTNPGAEAFAKQLDDLKIPEDKFLLCSIFGGNLEEFIQTAKILVDKVDGFELNFSCPHAAGHGQAFGQDLEMSTAAVREIKKIAGNKPVLPKISPNLANIPTFIKSYEEAGADGFVAINTLGPGLHTVDGNPVLSNHLGGMSGKGVLPMGLKTVREITQNTNLPILACGGIIDANDVKEYAKLNSEFFGIGSSLTGMDSKEVQKYFQTVEKDLEENTNNSAKLLKTKEQRAMEYVKVKIVEKNNFADDACTFKVGAVNPNDKDKIKHAPFGKFAFVWIPGLGEKPFSVYGNEPMEFLVQKVGFLSSKIMELKEGDEVFVRGNYGKEIKLSGKVLVVGGGSGIASFKVLAQDPNLDCKFVFGTRTKNRIPDREVFEKGGDLVIATDDGSEGYHGFVTDFLADTIKEFKPDYIVNCGPKPMLYAVEKIEKELVSRNKIYSSFEEMTKCGVGICGACARAEDGLRSCIDGPFLNPKG